MWGADCGCCRNGENRDSTGQTGARKCEIGAFASNQSKQGTIRSTHRNLHPSKIFLASVVVVDSTAEVLTLP